MAKKQYRELEEHLIKTFNQDRIFWYMGKIHETLFAGKPVPQGAGGECKTDVFVRCKCKEDNSLKDIKISVKTDGSNEFQYNKITPEIANDIFGDGWENIISKSSESIAERFQNIKLLYASGKHPTKPNSITMGWKLEIANKPRNLSVKIGLSDQEIRDYVYKGTTLPKSKRDSYVVDKVIPDSGVADYLIKTTINDIKTSNDIINTMESIDTAEIGETYLIYTANNYRTDVKKADGPRCLAVRVEWYINALNKLASEIKFDKPLHYTGQNDMAPKAVESLKMIGKENISEINPNMDLDNPDIFLE